MSSYHDQAPDDARFGFNLSFDKNLSILTIERLTSENSRLRLQLEEAQAKIQRLINQADEGEEL